MRRLDFSSLQVRDLEASKAFYTDKLGFEQSEQANPGAVIFKYNKGEACFAIKRLDKDLGTAPLGNGVSMWFSVDENIDSLQECLKEKGVQILSAVIDTPFGKAFHIEDPDGYRLTFM